MNYRQTIDYLYNTLPMFSRMGSAAFKKDLTNTLLLCNTLGNPHKKFKSIHVGGTNGKGSVSHMLAAILQTAGYKTGLYTSPHLYDFRERIKINGKMVPEKFVIDFVDQMKPAMEEIQPSFFEITVAMAFEYFAREKVDIAVVEVGLGGRLDSTNVIRPELSVITNIGWDHMNLLGNTLEEIAFEKAGIIKEGIPVVIGEEKTETAFVFKDIAYKKQAPIYFADQNFSIREYQLPDTSIRVSVEDPNAGIMEYESDLPGIYQTKNMLTVLQSVELLKKWNILQQHVRTGLKKTRELTGLQGRWETIRKEPRIVLEVAHNKEGIQQMLQHLENTRYNELHLVMGMVKDKDAEAVLEGLPKNVKYYFTQAHIPRALDAAALQAKALNFSLEGDCFDNVNAALREALSRAEKTDLVVVCGSIFLVAEVDRESIAHHP